MITYDVSWVILYVSPSFYHIIFTSVKQKVTRGRTMFKLLGGGMPLRYRKRYYMVDPVPLHLLEG